MSIRWSIQLASPAVIANGQALPELSDVEGRSAAITISRDGQAVEFVAEARGRPSRVRPAHPEWYNRAHLVVMLDPGHDHATQQSYGVDDSGTVHASASWVAPGEEPGDRTAYGLDDPTPGEGSFQQLGEDAFRATLRLPAGQVWADADRPAGLRVKVGFHEECIPTPLRWPATMAWAGDDPLAFGDLYRCEPPLRVDQIDIASPAWSEPVELAVRGSVSGGAPRSGLCRARSILPGDSEEASEPVAWRAEAGQFEACPVVRFSHRGKWATDMASTGALELAFTDDAGAALWTGCYPFGFDLGIIVRERFGPRGTQPPPRPEPGDPDFVEKFRQYVLARLPDYRPATTRDAAPSDFYLTDPGGEAHLDLAAADWPERLADLLGRRFERWDDALAAAAMWIYHPAVTRHSAEWSRISGVVTARSIPRLGGCFCGDTARLGAMLAEELGRQYGVELRGLSMGLRGHLTTLVETPVGRVVIDGMLGLWFHALDNTRLATLEEMRSDRRVVERMWYWPRRHGHEFFHGYHEQIIRRWDNGALEFPPGAPK